MSNGNPVKELKGRLRSAEERLDRAINDGPDGSFREGLAHAEEVMGEVSGDLFKAQEFIDTNLNPDTEEHVDVMFGYNMLDHDEYESYKDFFGEDVLKAHKCDDESNVIGIEWEFSIPKSKVKSFYLMLQMMAGLDMPLQAPDTCMGMFVNGERYNGD